MVNAGIKHRKKDPGKIGKNSPQAKVTRGRVEELLDDEESESDKLGIASSDPERRATEQDRELELDPEGKDLEDNLTFHEDSLSVMRGTIATSVGSRIPIWITTDSGSMTQLIVSKQDFPGSSRFRGSHCH